MSQRDFVVTRVMRRGIRAPVAAGSTTTTNGASTRGPGCSWVVLEELMIGQVAFIVPKGILPWPARNMCDSLASHRRPRMSAVTVCVGAYWCKGGTARHGADVLRVARSWTWSLARISCHSSSVKVRRHGRNTHESGDAPDTSAHNCSCMVRTTVIVRTRAWCCRGGRTR